MIGLAQSLKIIKIHIKFLAIVVLHDLACAGTSDLILFSSPLALCVPPTQAIFTPSSMPYFFYLCVFFPLFALSLLGGSMAKWLVA